MRNLYITLAIVATVGASLTLVGVAHAAPPRNHSAPPQTGQTLAEEKVTEAHARTCARLENIRQRHPQVGLPPFCDATLPPKPTLTFQATPTSIDLLGTSTLSWDSEYTNSCTASGAWSGTKSTTGSEVVTPSETKTYTLTCEGSGGEITRSVTVTVNPPPPAEPEVNLIANPATIVDGATSTLSWSSTNATSCEASGGWSGSRALSGTEIISPSATTTYTITCQGDGGSDSDSATVNVTPIPIPAPLLTFGGSPGSITEGGTSTLTWISTNATSCEASNAWSGVQPLSGNTIVSPTLTSTYTLTCEGGGNSVQSSVTITVNPLPPPELDHVVISEVYYDVLIPTRGTNDSAHEWVELYNDSNSPIDVSGWTIGDAASPDADVLPALSVIPANGFLLIVASSTTAGFWADTIPAGIPIVNLGGSIGSGMNQDGDAVYLKNTGVTVDALSYGSNVDVFNPAAPDVADGHSLRRDGLTSDTNSADDFEDRESPTPGSF